MTEEGAGLNYTTAAEWEALAVKWDRLPEEQQEALTAQMNRAQRKRFERAYAKAQDGKRNFANQHATREDVIQILAMYIDRHLIPLAQQMDTYEARLAFLEKPWYRRLWVKLLIWLAARWDQLEGFLERRGIRLVQWRSSGESSDLSGTGAPGSDEPADGGGALEVQDKSPEPRLHGSERGHDVGGHGKPDIRVVSR